MAKLTLEEWAKKARDLAWFICGFAWYPIACAYAQLFVGAWMAGAYAAVPPQNALAVAIFAVAMIWFSLWLLTKVGAPALEQLFTRLR